jgi:hypothetical protein
MRQLLDTIYSSDILLWVSAAVILFICLALYFAKPFNNPTYNTIYKILIGLFALFVLLVPQFTYYGYAMDFEKMIIGKSHIFLLESYPRRVEGINGDASRLHVVDKQTGELKARFYVGGYGDLVGSRNDTVCYLDDMALFVYDATSLKEIYHVKESEWKTISEEFAPGIESVKHYSGSDAYSLPLISLTSKNGKSFPFDPFSKKLYDAKAPGNYVPGNLALSLHSGEAVPYLTTSPAGGKLERIVPYQKSEKLFHVKDSGAYIDPFLMCVDIARKVFVFACYATTDKTDFVFEAKDFDFKTLWKKTAGDLEIEESAIRKADIAVTDKRCGKVDLWSFNNGTLYFNYGGYMLALDPVTGNTLWKSRL